MEFVIAIVGSIVAKAVEYTISPIKNHVKYLSNHQQYVETLKDRAERLKDARVRVQHSVDAAKRNGEEIEGEVDKWLSAVDNKILEQVEKVMQDEEKAKKKCSIGLCPNFRTRYKLSLRAEEEAKAVAELLEHGKFERVSYRAAPQGIVVAPVKGYEEFESRTSILNGIMEALKDDSVSVVGVHGTGGIGKTTLVKEIARKFKDKLFDSVVIATVTQVIDVEKIQNQIADFLGLKFEEQSMVGKAIRLRERLKKEKSILVVLDDIWEKVDIDEVGIPLGDEHKRCKLLLTSRELNVLSNEMDPQKNFPVGFLKEKEAWDLFKKMAGNCDERLPIVIATVAGALRNKRLFEWKNALRELGRPSSSNFTGITAAYSAIEWSFNYLESKEVKLTFLLCSVIGHNGLVEDLVRYTLGLGLFDGVHTMEEARNKVLTVVANLKASALLLDGYNDKRFDIHDVVWDAAIAIALKDYRMLVLRDHAPKEWSDKEKMKTWNVISLRCPHIVANLPKEMECSGLSFFHMAYDGAVKIPLNFFKQTEGLKALDLVGMQFQSLRKSIIHLADLRMLCLKKCAVDDITILGELKSLQVLNLSQSGIKELPKEMAQLTQLRLLDLSWCRELKIIPPNVLSGLSKLEELYMDESFVEWEKGGNNLPCLTTLYVHILDLQMIPKHWFVETLDRFRIFVGNYGIFDCCLNYESPKALKLKLYTNIDLDNGMKKLLIKTEDLCLEGLKGVKNVLVKLNNRKDLLNLKRLHVKNGRHVQYIKTNKIGFSELCFITLENLPQLVSFCSPDERCSTMPFLLFNKQTCHWVTNLRSLIIKGCGKLEHLLSPSLARSLVQLQCFEIKDCNCLRDIILTEEIEEERKDVICFPRLNSLHIVGLPNLIFFNSGNHNIEFPLLKVLKIERCPNFIEFISQSSNQSGMHALFSEKVAFPRLEKMTIKKLRNVKMMFHNNFAPGSFQNLRVIRVEGCGSLKNLFPVSIAKDLPQLEDLCITNCGVEEIVSKGEGVEEQPVRFEFPQVSSLEVTSLKELKCFYEGQHTIVWPLLKKLKTDCSALLKIVASEHLRLIQGNEQPVLLVEEDGFYDGYNLDISDTIPKSIEIWIRNPQEILGFKNLVSLHFYKCSSLKYIFTSSMLLSLNQLQWIKVKECSSMEQVIREEAMTDKFTFLALFSIRIELCSNLTNFYLGSQALEFPELYEIAIFECPKMTTFSSSVSRGGGDASENVVGEGGVYDHPAIFFSNKVVIPCLQHLELSFVNIHEIWHHPSSPSIGFLSSLQVKRCHNLKYLFPSFLVKDLVQLRRLEILDCNMMEQVIFTDGLVEEHQGRNQMFFSELELLWLKDLPKLTSFCFENYFEFQCLTDLELTNCPLLKTFITKCVSEGEPEIGQHVQASNLEVHNSSLLNEKVVFPSLEKLRIQNCDSLEQIIELQGVIADESQSTSATQSIMAEIETTKFVFPKLINLGLDKVPRLKSFYSRMHTTQWPSLKQMDIIECPKVQILTPQCPECQVGISNQQPLFCVNEDTFPILEELTLKTNDMVKGICDGQLSLQCFQNLKLLNLQFFPEASTTLPYSFIRSLPMLHKLVIDNTSICQIVQSEGLSYDERNTSVFYQLKELSLCQLPELTLKTFEPSLLSFKNLTTLEVSSCHGFINLIACSTAKCLTLLERLSIDDCGMIEEIIACEAEEMQGGIVFPKLQYLQLSCLPCLASFSLAHHLLEFPVLLMVKVTKCSKMRNFCQGDLSTPRLEQMHLTRDEEGELQWEGDLNTTIKHMFDEMNVQNLEVTEVTDQLPKLE
ncbi:hypothetical protein ES332_D10G297400v1 [Gossypium tomentosum]|nr:hypothetical protein ES332_D10G297400v1 [Gossypium tomentosum]